MAKDNPQLDKYQRILSSELKSSVKNLKRLNKRKNLTLRKDITGRLINVLIDQGVSKEQSGKVIRELGIKLSNSEIRSLYDSVKKTSYSPERLRSNYRPNINRIPLVDFKNAKTKGMFFYVCRIYLICPDEDRTKKLPKKAKQIGSYNRYNDKSEYGIWYDELLTKNEVINGFLDFFGGDADEEYIPSDFTSASDWKNISKSACDVVGIEYIRVIRS